MKPGQLAITDRHYNRHTDSYVVMGRMGAGAGQPKTARPWAVAFVSRHRETKMCNVRRFMDEGSARRAFGEVIAAQEFPHHRSLTADWQKERVYGWEGDFVYPHKRGIGAREARALIARVSADYGIEPPLLVMERKTDCSWYEPVDHEIHFGHRDTVGLLHELAHAVYELNRDEELPIPDHSPGFVWTAIELYHRYAGLDLSYLVVSAGSRGLLGDLQANQFIHEAPLAKSKQPARAPHAKP